MTVESAKQLSKDLKQRFLELYPQFRMISRTSEAMGIDEHNYYNWVKDDTSFSEAFQQVKNKVAQSLLDRHETDLDDMSFDKNTPAASRVVGHIVRLKRLDPEYRDKVPEQFPREITVKLALPEREYKRLPDVPLIEAKVT